MPPVPVIPQRASHDSDTFTPHDAESAVKVASADGVGIGVGPTGVEAAFSASSVARKVLGKKMRVAKGMAEQRAACLVEILAVDENQDLCSRVCRECCDHWVRHPVIKSD
jgi:hypothetical protein